MNNKKPLLGAHVSIVGGFYKALERGENLECTAIQIFTHSNRQWKTSPISKEQVELYKEKKNSSSIKEVVAHASYLINIGSPDNAIREKSISALAYELELCDKLNIPFLVLHPGSYTKSTIDQCIETIAESINSVFKKYPSKTVIALETSAGQGSSVGKTVQELKKIGEKIEIKERIGYCVDTCHIFAAGYDIATEKGFDAFWKEFESELGLKNLKAIHLNDSKKECGSYVDRHESIGKGKIGIDVFKKIMNDSRFLAIPKIIETPEEYNKENLITLKRLI
jgi:deoxyribonuclease-4